MLPRPNICFPKCLESMSFKIKPSAIAFSSSSSKNFTDMRAVVEKNATLNFKNTISTESKFSLSCKWCNTGLQKLFQDHVVFFRPFVFNFHAHAWTDFSSAMLLLVSKKKRIKICNTSWSEIHTVVLNCKRKSTLATLTWTTVPWFSKKKKINVSSRYMYNSSLIFEN